MEEKPKVKLIGQDGNVFNLIGLCSRALKKAGKQTEATEFQRRVLSAGSYDEALMIMGEYVDIR